MSIHIRAATNQDRNDICDLYMRSFPAEERHLVAKLASDLLHEQQDPAIVTLVALKAAELIGHVAFSPVFAVADRKCVGYILAPLAVNPEQHGAGIGSKLVEAGIARLTEKGTKYFLVYGDPKYYGRFGFSAKAASQFLPPYELKFPFGWLATQPSNGSTDEKAVRLSCVEPLHDPALW